MSLSEGSAQQVLSPRAELQGPLETESEALSNPRLSGKI